MLFYRMIPPTALTDVTEHMSESGDKQTLADRIATAVITKYAELPAKGKPQGKEHTILAGLVRRHEDTIEVISLGSGSGCVHCEKVPLDGSAVSDGHAEVMCRRGFMNYLYDQIGCWMKGDTDTSLTENNNRLEIIGTLHMYISQPPCGDGCIGAVVSKDDSTCLSTIKRIKSESTPTKDCSTGARVVIRSSEAEYYSNVNLVSPCNVVDTLIFKEHGDGNHGHVRNKPGRGTLSISMSCSDKLCCWNAAGLEGQLLSTFITKCSLKTITVANCSNVHQLGLTINRATQSPVSVLHTDVPFCYSAPTLKALDRTMCGYSLSYNNMNNKSSGVVNVIISGSGYTAGASKKSIASGRATSPLSKVTFAQKYIRLVANGLTSRVISSSLCDVLESIKKRLLSTSVGGATTYASLKVIATHSDTKRLKTKFLSNPPFTNWVQKDPKLNNFEVKTDLLNPQ